MKKKIIIYIIGFLLVIVVCVLFIRHIRLKNYMIKYNQRGILLSFDDYNEKNWTEYFDLFDKYNVKVTFFVTLSEPTDFCAEAIKRGHEIGYHTAEHVNITELSEEECYQQAIAPIEVFRSKGYELSSFAYPYGAYTEQLNEKLLQYYDTVRGAYKFEVRYKRSIQNGFVESYPLDNISFKTDEEFLAKIDELLDVLINCEEGTIAPMYSHAIGEGDWCITPRRLEMLFQEAEERDLVFYTFKELQ